MSAAHRIAGRILALPPNDQRRAVAHFQRLVEEHRAALGPRAISPLEMARRVGIDPDPWQADALSTPATRILMNCSRQSGKSTVSSLLAFHAACYEPDSLVLLLSPSLRQSQELFKKVLDVHRKLDRPVDADAESALRLELRNGSRIVSLPGKEHSIRGFSGVRLIIIDEAARVPDDLYLSVRPMLAVSGGRLVALSTPFGTRGWWYEAWRSAEDWKRYEIPATECPRIAQSFLDEERRTMGEWWFDQEYGCRFLDAETQPFGRDDIDRAFEEEVEAWAL